MKTDQQVIDPLPPEVQECIDAYGRYYAEQHKLGMSVRDDMKYVASVAIRSVAVPESGTNNAAGQSTTGALPQTVRELLETAGDQRNSDDYIGKVFRARADELRAFVSATQERSGG